MTIMKKRFLSMLTAITMIVGLVGVMPTVSAGAVCSGDIVGNGLGGIYINVRSAPYTTFANNGYSPYQRGGCGWFASARAYELTGKCKTTWNGQGWWNRGTNYGYTKGQTAKAKALICWTGHIAVLEKIDGNTAYISEGGSWKGTAASGYTVIRTVSVSAISSMNSGFLGYVYLGVDGGSSSGGSSSIWGNDYMNLGSDFYALIINSKNWKCLTNDGDNVSIRTETGSANQVWHFKYDSDGYYKIYNCKDGKALDVNGSSADSGTNVKVYDDHITAAQLWRIYGNNIAYYLKPKCSDCILDISNNSSEEGTNVQIWESNGSDAQIFSIWKKNTPGKSTLSYSTKCSTVNFTWSKTNDTTKYSLRIFKNGSDYNSKYDLTTTNTSVELSSGTYKAYIDSCNNYSYTKSNEVTFTISGNHNYTSKETTPANCTKNGIRTFTCTICGKSYTEEIKATGHNYNDWTTTKPATCTTEGTKTRKCSVCGNTETQTIAATGHKYSTEWTIDKAATCTEKGSKSHHCTVCGDKTDIIEIAETGHKYGGWTTKAATCTVEGTKTRKCSVCGNTETQTIAATGHRYSTEWTIDKAATCTEKGSKSHHCTVCGDKKDVTEVAATGHKYVTSVVNPTETEKGYTLHKCSICGESYKDNYVDPLKPDEPIEEPTEEPTDPPYGDFNYTILEDGTVEITGYTGNATELTIPSEIEGKSVTSIGDYAFNDCYSLERVTIPSSVEYVTEQAFDRCYSFKEINVSEDNQYYSSLDGVLYDKEKTELILCPCVKSSVSIPDSVEYIGNYAFEDCSSLISITIPDSVTSIGDSAFSYCSSLTSITIPDCVTSIGWVAFYGCDGLTDVYYTSSEEEWNNIYIGDNNDALLNATIHFNSTGPDITTDPTDPTEPTTHLGDLSDDGKITTVDVGIINSFAKGTKEYTDEQLKLADANSDGKITTVDVGLINKIAKGV